MAANVAFCFPTNSNLQSLSFTNPPPCLRSPSAKLSTLVEGHLRRPRDVRVWESLRLRTQRAHHQLSVESKYAPQLESTKAAAILVG